MFDINSILVLYRVYTRPKNSSRTVLRVDVNGDGMVPNRTGPPKPDRIVMWSTPVHNNSSR